MKLPCGCYGMLVGEQVVIDASAFLCPYRHDSGLRLTLADVASLAVAEALNAYPGASATPDSGSISGVVPSPEEKT